MKRKRPDPRPLDGLIVGLLSLIVIMMAYSILMHPVPNSTSSRTAEVTPSPPPPGPSSSGPPASNGGQETNGGQPSAGPTLTQASPGLSGGGNGEPGSGGQPGHGGQPGNGGQPGRGGQLHMREYLAGIIALDADPKLQLTAAQARELAPALRDYQQATDAVPSARNVILEMLSPEQRAWLEKNLPKSGPPVPDPNHTAEELMSTAVEKVLKAIQGR